MPRIARYGIVAAFAVAFAMPARTEEKLSPTDEVLIARIERYINAMGNVSGEFRQVSSNGSSDSGRFYIKRPGRMRLEYKSPMLLVADGESLVYHDKKLDQISYLPLSGQPAAVILKERASFSDPEAGITIHEVRQLEGSRTAVLLGHQYSSQSGSMSLIFDNAPLSIAGWQVKDAHGITTDVTLYNIKESPEPLPDSLFKITRRGAFDGQKNKFY